MKAKLRSFVWKIASKARSVQQFLLDEHRYRLLSVPTQKSALARISGVQLECQVTKDYHRIEKGLSFASPKRPFGGDARSRLDLAMRGRKWTDDEIYASYANDALAALDRWNADGLLMDDVTVDGASLGTAGLTIEQARQFFTSRRSIRAFDVARSPSVEDIVEAVELATNTPSVCNRQSGRVHFFAGADAQRILRHQKGNRGFGETIPSVLVVTVDARLFSGSGERNQRWVDGGLFAMTLLWALHSRGMATCMLNWSRSYQDSRALRAEAEIPESEDVILMIAVGYPVSGFRVARSARRDVDQVLSIHSPPPHSLEAMER